MEHIGFRPQILGLLRRLLKNRCLLAVRFDDDAQIYHSVILDLDAEQNRLVLDELTPEKGHATFLQQRRCRIRAELKGVTLVFSAVLLEPGTRDGIAFYRCAIPSSVNYGQRRAHYRPRVGHAKRTPAELRLPEGTTLTGYLQDVSLGGLRIKLDGPLGHVPPDTLLECRLALPGSGTFTCTVELRFISGGPAPQLGVKFTSLQPGQRQILQKFVRELEREELKKSPRDTV